MLLALDEFHTGKPTSRNAQCQVQMYKCGRSGREGKGRERRNATNEIPTVAAGG